jgi:putative transposase
MAKAARGLTKETLRELVTITSPATLLRWMNADNKPKFTKKPSPRKPGRPRTSVDVRTLIVRIATETGWGYTRVLGEVLKLGYRRGRDS